MNLLIASIIFFVLGCMFFGFGSFQLMRAKNTLEETKKNFEKWEEISTDLRKTIVMEKMGFKIYDN